MSKKIIRLAASSLKESACDYRLYMIVIEGYCDILPMNDTQYGTAVHKFISQMYLTGGNLMEAYKAAKIEFHKPSEPRDKKAYLTEAHFTKTCFDYWQEFLQKDDFELLINDATNLPLVEVTFEIKIYEDENYIVYLNGTIDKIGKFKNGCYAIGDYKTTSSWDIKNYFTQYELSTQLLTYLYALKKMGEQHPQSILGHINQFPVGAFIDGIFLKSAKETTFKRSEVFYLDRKHKEELLAEYEKQLMIKATDLVKTVETGFMPSKNGLLNGACANGYGTSSPMGALCRFFQVCACKDDIARAHVLKNNFQKKEYHPLHYNS